MTIKGIIFDKDGTLIKFKETFGPATKKVIYEIAQADENITKQMAQKAGYNIIDETFNDNSVIIAGSVEDIAQVWEVENDTVDKLFLKYTAQTIQPFECLIETLEKLKNKNVVMGVGTNDSQEGAETHMNAIKATKYFSHMFGYDSGFGAKPEAGMIVEFAKQTKIKMENIAMVGDSMHDIKAGQNAGAITIGISSGSNKTELQKEADYVLDSIAELPELMDKI